MMCLYVPNLKGVWYNCTGSLAFIVLSIRIHNFNLVLTFPVQREVGSVSHWSWRYLVVEEMRHKKPSQGLPKS